jgi:hypothetical protein
VITTDELQYVYDVIAESLDRVPRIAAARASQ